MTRGPSRLLFAFSYLLCLALLFEVAFRLYLRTQYGSFHFHPSAAILKRYPVMHDVRARRLQRDDARMKVLFLGASSLHPDYGDVVERVRRKLSAAGIEANLVNLSDRAYTTRDSYFQYDLLKDKTFDAVVFYHGINEVRANNCPPDVYRADYAHYAWYDEIDTAVRHQKSLRYSVLPYCFDLLGHRIHQRLHRERYVPANRPSPEWMAYGAQIKTPPAFRANMEHMLDAARHRGDTPILLTFAWYVPTNYTEQAFRLKQLDYGKMVFPIELWGLPSNVVAGIQAHNAVIRDLATAHPEADFLDMEQTIPKDGRYFDDICHFSRTGSELFAHVLAQELIARWCNEHPNAVTRAKPLPAPGVIETVDPATSGNPAPL